MPTEAEWEDACRAGSATLYSHGDDPEGLASLGNVGDATSRRKPTNYKHWTYIKADDGYVFTAPVGQFRPNGSGVYDTHGNVWERCSDWYDEDYYADSATDDPSGPSTGSNRVDRGGGWNSSAGLCRSAYRFHYSPVNRDGNLGFRVACSLVDASGR